MQEEDEEARAAAPDLHQNRGTAAAAQVKDGESSEEGAWFEGRRRGLNT